MRRSRLVNGFGIIASGSRMWWEISLSACMVSAVSGSVKRFAPLRKLHNCRIDASKRHFAAEHCQNVKDSRRNRAAGQRNTQRMDDAGGGNTELFGHLAQGCLEFVFPPSRHCTEAR